MTMDNSEEMPAQEDQEQIIGYIWSHESPDTQDTQSTCICTDCREFVPGEDWFWKPVAQDAMRQSLDCYVCGKKLIVKHPPEERTEPN